MCDEPLDGATYLIQGENYTSCLDSLKREAMFFDTFKYSSDAILPVETPPIPDFVPTIARSGMKIHEKHANVTFAVSLGKVYGVRKGLLYRDVAEIKAKFGLPSNSKVALLCTGDDAVLERLWKVHEIKQVFERISQMGFVWATSLSFSVWRNEFPRPDQLRNFYRNLYTCDVMNNLGLPCVPFLFPVLEKDFENLSAWLRDRPHIDTVAIYARYYHESNKFPKLINLLDRIEEIADRPFRFLISGMGKASNIAFLRDRYDCRFENSKVFEKALHGEIASHDLTYIPSKLDRNELFSLNYSRTGRFCQPKPLVYLKKPSKIGSSIFELVEMEVGK